MQEKKNWIKKVYWDDVREQVAAVNPEFAAEVDKLSPGKDLPLYHVAYSYGESLIKDGKLYIPNDEGEIVSINDSSVPQSLKDSFLYAPNMPISVLLKNTVELYLDFRNTPIPRIHMYPGRILALWGSLQRQSTTSLTVGNIWQISAGARSLIILPKFSYERSFDRVRKAFNLKLDNAHDNMFDQWNVFTELFRSDAFNESWQTELLFLPSVWNQKIHTDFAWQSLKIYLLERVLNDTDYLRDQHIFEFTVSKALAEKNMRPNPYLADTVKHLFLVNRGAFPAFKVATNDMAGPIARIQSIFADIYRLKQAPTMMHLDNMSNILSEGALYYSFNYPTVMEFSPKSHNVLNKLNDLREANHIYQVIKNYFLKSAQDFKGLPIYDSVVNRSFYFVHFDNHGHDEITESKDLPELDKNLYDDLQKYPDLPFCSTSQFFRGCIMLQKT